jgi:DNA (cytosine-5)-methyltransferase 1
MRLFSTHSGLGMFEYVFKNVHTQTARSVGGVDINPYVVDLYRKNHGRCILGDILELKPSRLPDFDFLWSSPSCQNFSRKKIVGQGEKRLDREIASKIAQIIETKAPSYFVLENVPDYIKSDSFDLIISYLNFFHYYVDYRVVDAAAFGSPQNRKRLVLRASKEHKLNPLEPTHGSGLLPYVGWWETIKDLPARPTHLTDKQIESLSVKTTKEDRENYHILIQRVGGYKSREQTVRFEYEPCWTLLASASYDGKNGYRSAMTHYYRGLCYSVDQPHLARLQGFSEDYEFGDSAGRNCHAIGNSIPYQLVEAVINSML